STGGSASGINDAGAIVGLVGMGAGANGFVLASGTYSLVQYPSSAYTEAAGINSHGDIVGQIDSADAPFRGFRRASGQFDTVDLRGRAGSWDARGINDLGMIVGTFTDADGHTHGYRATPATLKAGPDDPNGAPASVTPGASGPAGPAGVAGPAGPAGPAG